MSKVCEKERDAESSSDTLKRDDGDELSALDSLELIEVVIITTTGQRVVSARVSEMDKTIRSRHRQLQAE